MNPIEQRNHRTVTATLAQSLQDVANAAAARMDRIDARINDERTHRLKLANEQRAYVDDADRLNRLALGAFVGRGFWSRLNWLLTGR